MVKQVISPSLSKRYSNLYTARITNIAVLILLVLSCFLPVLVNPGVVYADDIFIKLPNPAILPDGGKGLSVAFSHDSTYLAVGHYSIHRVTIYKRSGDTFTKLADPDILPAGEGNGVAFSHDSTYLAVAHTTSPYVTIYKRSGDSFTKVANPDILPTGNGMGVAFSHDSTYLAVAHNTSPYVTIYRRSGDSFTKLANPAILPDSSGNGVAFSHDSTYLAVAHGSSRFVTIYKRSGDIFTKLDDPAELPPPYGTGVDFSYNSTYLAVSSFINSPYITIYKRSGDTFTKLANPATLPGVNGQGVAFDHNSTYMAVVTYGPVWLTIYRQNGDTFTKIANPATLPAGEGNGVAFSHDSSYMAVAHDNAPTITIYKIVASPAFVSAATNAAGTTITITFNKSMANPAGKQGQFTYSVNGGAAQSFSAAALNADNTRIDLTCSGTAIAFGDTVTVSYTKGTVLAADGGVLESFTNQAVTIPNPARAITAFYFNMLTPPVIGVVDEGAKTVALTVPFATDVTTLVPTITITGASINPASGVANNFITPQIYTVTAANGLTQAYTVTVTVTANPFIGTGGQTSHGGGSGSGTGTTSTTTQTVSLTNIQTQSASLSARTVTPGTPVTVTADVINKGTGNGTKKVMLYVNGQVESTQGVAVNSGSSSKLTFNLSRSEPGEYDIYVDGVPAGSFKVEMMTGNDVLLIISAVLIATAFLFGLVMLRRKQAAG